MVMPWSLYEQSSVSMLPYSSIETMKISKILERLLEIIKIPIPSILYILRNL